MNNDTVVAALNEVSEELGNVRGQLRTEKWWRRAIGLALVLTVLIGIRMEDVRRDQEDREERKEQASSLSQCLFSNENRTAIRDSFEVLITTFLANVPADDPRHARAQQFTARINERLPARDCR